MQRVHVLAVGPAYLPRLEHLASLGQPVGSIDGMMEQAASDPTPFRPSVRLRREILEALGAPGVLTGDPCAVRGETVHV